PDRPRRQRTPSDRQEELRRARAARELLDALGRDHPRQAVSVQGPLHQTDHVDDDDGTGNSRRRVEDARPDRRAGWLFDRGGSYSYRLTGPPKTVGSPTIRGRSPAEAGSRWSLRRP